MSEKNNPAIGPDDGSVASVGEVEGDRGIPQVGRKKPVTRIWWIMGVGVLIVCLVALAAVAGLNKVKNRNKGAEPEKANVTTNVPELSASAFATDEPPPLPEGTAPAQPAPSSAPGAPTAQGEPKLTPEQQKALDLAERRKRAPVLGVAGSVSSGQGDDEGGDDRARGNGSGSLGQALKATRLGAVSATRLPEPDLTITAGKLLQCTLETAIATDVPGMTSCVLAQDVYSTTGRVLLLERGSRIIGQYQSGTVRRGQSRVFVLWTRAETPNGVLVNLDSPATDTLGRSGVEGKINRHFWERFGSALLVSLVDDVASYMVARERNNSGNTTAINFGNTADSSRDAAAIIVENSVNIPPTLNKAQGESIGIFVARDLYFGDVYQLQPTRTLR